MPPPYGNIAGDSQAEASSLKSFKIQKFLGKGSYGYVYKVQRLSNNQMYVSLLIDAGKLPD
jgi:hypothetical protein